MTDAEYEAALQRIKPLVERWYTMLGLKWWRVTTEYCREGLLTKPNDGLDGYSVTSDCAVRWQYNDARIRISMPGMADLDDDTVERIIVHECMHVLLNELRDVSDDWLKHEEHAASLLTKAVLWVRDMTREEAKNAE